MRDDRARLRDILEAIGKIEERAVAGREAFFRDELVQIWVIHHITIIGEAANNVSDALQARYPEMPWRDIIAMRNVLVHQYFGIDLFEIWDSVDNDLPQLKSDIERILRELEGENA
jgi:uncharacterized protein with HEPN domain